MINQFAQRLKSIVRDETGPTAVEYAVLLSLIVIVCLGAVKQLSNATGTSYDRTASAIDSAMK